MSQDNAVCRRCAPAVLIALVAWGSGTSASGASVSGTAARGTAAQTVELPRLEDAEPAVREKLEQAQTAAAGSREAGVWGRYGMVLEAHGFLQQARAAYRRARDLDDGEFRWVYYLAGTYDASDPEEAVVLYGAALEIDPTYGPAHLRLARTLEKLGRYDTAKRHYDETCRLDPTNPFGYLGLGQLALRTGDLEEAREQLSRSLRLDDQNRNVHNSLARLEHRLGDRAAARRHADLARELPRTTYFRDQLRAEIGQEAVDRQSFLLRSRTFREVGKLREARFELSRLLDIDPEFAPAHVALAELEAQSGDFEGSALSARRALDLDPDLHQARSRLAMALFELGRLDEAAQQARLTLETQPDDARLHVLLAMVYAERGADGQAVESVERAVAARPTDSATGRVLVRLLTSLAAAFVEVNELDAALRAQGQAVGVARDTRLEPALVADLERQLRALESRR